MAVLGDGECMFALAQMPHRRIAQNRVWRGNSSKIKQRTPERKRISTGVRSAERVGMKSGRLCHRRRKEVKIMANENNLLDSHKLSHSRQEARRASSSRKIVGAPEQQLSIMGGSGTRSETIVENRWKLHCDGLRVVSASALRAVQ